MRPRHGGLSETPAKLRAALFKCKLGAVFAALARWDLDPAVGCLLGGATRGGRAGSCNYLLMSWRPRDLGVKCRLQRAVRVASMAAWALT
eukprot:9482778-Pyramimonas_sp.AAC.1